MISEWRKHREKPVVPMYQERIHNLSTMFIVKDGGKQPFEITFVNTLGKKAMTPRSSRASVRVLEHRGGQREFDRSGNAVVMQSLQHARPPFLPLTSHSDVIPLAVMRNGSKQCDRKGMEVQLFQNLVDVSGLFALLVDPEKCVACSVYCMVGISTTRNQKGRRRSER